MKVRSESVTCSVMSDAVTQWTVVSQVPLSVGFSRQEYWSQVAIPFFREINLK